MIKLRDKATLGRIDIYRPSTYNEDNETHSNTRRSNNIENMYYVGYLRDVLGVVKDDDGIYYLKLVVSFNDGYLMDEYFSTTDLLHHQERLLGSNHDEILDYAETYNDEFYEEGMFDSVLRLPFISFTKSLMRSGNLSMLDLADRYVSDPNINVDLSAVEEYTRSFDRTTGGINFYTDDMRFSNGAWIPIGSGYYIKVSDTLIQNNAYVKYVKDTTYWTGSGQGQIPITRKIMDLLNEMDYTKVEITDDDGVVNTYPIKPSYYRGYENTILLNTVLYGVSGGFYHPFLDDTIDLFSITYVNETRELRTIIDLLNRSVIEHFFNNTDLYTTELRLSDKIKLIK